MTNDEIADRLEEVAELLELDPRVNPFRVGAYREGAATVRTLPEPVTLRFRHGGPAELQTLHGIGAGLAASIAELIDTGRLGLLDRLREQARPEAAFETLPGVGPVLAARIHDRLDVETLPELEQAAQEGRLRDVPGVGVTLERHIRDALELRLQRRRPRSWQTEPPVAELLAVDREYREKSHAGRLHKIAPRRFNAGNEAWLPILQTRRGQYRYTAVFSNTALAHRLGKTNDWVVLYYALPGESERQVTVVTGTQGELKDRRVVRGREQECEVFYRQPGGNRRAA